MAKGNLGLLVMEELAEENVLVGLKMADMEKRMIHRVHMVMVKGLEDHEHFMFWSERCVKDLRLIWRNMVEFHEEVLQGSFDVEILLKTGNVRNCGPF
ncbi:hypothetical protein WN943_015040 [Citrus x changshan-huyou]